MKLSFKTPKSNIESIGIVDLLTTLLVSFFLIWGIPLMALNWTDRNLDVIVSYLRNTPTDVSIWISFALIVILNWGIFVVDVFMVIIRYFI